MKQDPNHAAQKSDSCNVGDSHADLLEILHGKVDRPL